MTKKPPFYIPNCEHPQLLVNPRALYLLQQGGRPSHQELRLPAAYADPETVPYYYHFSKLVLGQSKDYKRLAEYYVVGLDGVQFEYVYTVAKCGRCPICGQSRTLDLVNRCKMESELYSSPCWCFCLTYDDKHLPGLRKGTEMMPRGRILYQDVQRFFKRLRIAWDRAGVRHDIRYLVACEYGKKRHRPHYHVLLWNDPYAADEWHPYLWKRLREDIFQAWHMCHRDVFEDPNNFRQAGDAAAGYAAKYAAKQSQYRLSHHLPPGYPPPSLHQSIGHGGLGRPFIERFRAWHAQNPAADRLEWCSRHDGSYHWCTIGSYIKGVLHPSPTRQVPAAVKSAYRQLCDVLATAVADGAVIPGYARLLASSYRPPHLPNLLPSASRIRSLCPCKLYRYYKLAMIWPVLEWLKNYLESYLIEPVDISLSAYYGYMFSLRPKDDMRGHLAMDELTARKNQSMVESKARL